MSNKLEQVQGTGLDSGIFSERHVSQECGIEEMI